MAGLLAPAVLTVLVASQYGEAPPSLYVGVGFAGMLSRLPDLTVAATMQDRKWLILPALVTTPTPVGWIVAGRSVGATLEALTALPLVWTLLIVMHSPPSTSHIVLLLAAVVIGSINLATLTAALMALIIPRRFRAGIVNSAFPLLVLAMGLFAPPKDLPAFIRPISGMFGATWAVEAVRAGETGGDPTVLIVMSILVTIVGLVAVGVLLARLDSAIRSSTDVVLP
jgi:ABC-type polysaccharide/polyol phosphate export permease